jgi:hypothetical protein
MVVRDALCLNTWKKLSECEKERPKGRCTQMGGEFVKIRNYKINIEVSI